jgi:hypothetical protein
MTEMRLHLQESRDAFLTHGLTMEAAEVEAIKAFGNGSAIVPRTDRWVDWRVKRTDVAYAVALWVMGFATFLSVALNRESPLGTVITMVATLVAVGWGLRRRCLPVTATLAAVLVPVLLVGLPTSFLLSPYRFPVAVAPERLAEYEGALGNHAARLSCVHQLNSIPDGGAYTVVRDGTETYPSRIERAPLEPTPLLDLAGESPVSEPSAPRFPTVWTPHGYSFPSKAVAVEALRAARLRIRDFEQDLVNSARALRSAERRAFHDPITNFQIVADPTLPVIGTVTGFVLIAQAIGALASRLAGRIDQRLRRSRR